MVRNAVREPRENHAYNLRKFRTVWRRMQVKAWGGIKAYVKMRFSYERHPKLEME
jgi:hypothetical protein